MAQQIFDDQIKASRQAETLIRNEANAVISQRDAEIHAHRMELDRAVTNATENLAQIESEMSSAGPCRLPSSGHSRTASSKAGNT